MTVSFISSQTQAPLSFRPQEQRILALFFPHLPTDRIARKLWGLSWRLKERPEHPPILCAGRRNNALRLTALDELAEAFNLKRGQGLAEARAMYPAVHVVDEDERADCALLEAVADWCDRYTPLVALNGNDGLFLDITGCSHLLGGEDALLANVLKRLKQMGFDVRGAISSSPGLSWAVSRFGNGGVIARDTITEILSPLPVEALRLDGTTVSALRKLGLKQVGDLMGMSRAPLARRFGAQLLLRLDQALGHNDESVSPRRPVASLSAERQLSEPVQAQDDILALTRDVAISLKQRLETRGLGGRVFELVLFRVDGCVCRIRAGASGPLRDPKRISGLFSERLHALHDDLDAGFGFELLRLNVLQHDDFNARQDDFTGGGSGGASLNEFIDKVSARLGTERLRVFRLRQSHIPERAEMLVPALAAARQPVKWDPATPFITQTSRPLRLLPHPEPMEAFAASVPDRPPQRFRWRRVVHEVLRAEGPERIAPEWWLEDEAEERDYFRLESMKGRCFWIFRSGRYDGKKMPTWRVHGIFA